MFKTRSRCFLDNAVSKRDQGFLKNYSLYPIISYHTILIYYNAYIPPCPPTSNPYIWSTHLYILNIPLKALHWSISPSKGPNNDVISDLCLISSRAAGSLTFWKQRKMVSFISRIDSIVLSTRSVASISSGKNRIEDCLLLLPPYDLLEVSTPKLKFSPLNSFSVIPITSVPVLPFLYYSTLSPSESDN